MFYIVTIIFLAIILYKSKLVEWNKEYLDKKYTNCIKGICAVMVVMNHMFEEARLWGILAVAMFFFYSGYGLMQGYCNKENYFKGFWKKRIKKVLLPFWITNVIYILVYIFVKNNSYTASEIILSFFNASIMTTGWYIIAAIIMYAIFYIVFKYLKTSNTKKIILNMILIFCYIILARFVGCKSWWYTSILGFGLGLIWAYKRESIDDYIKNKYRKLCIINIIIFIILYSLPYLIGRFDGVIIVGSNIILTLIFIILANIIVMKIKLYNKVLIFIGNISLEMYLIYPLVIKTLGFSEILKIVEFLFIIVVSKIYNFCLKKIYNDNSIRGKNESKNNSINANL